jgi:light-regulated signal transduction histidine kinase (bacteriophytochrome)
LQASAQDGPLAPFRVSLPGGEALRVMPHRQAGRGIVELERIEDEPAAMLARQQEAVSGFAACLDAIDSTIDVARTATQVIKALTGYDRVMIYRFHEDLHGEVIAEDRNTDLESWLGLHYPAFDIPAPARALFAVNKLRMIPDVDYTPVPVVHIHGEAPSLDLTRALLRSVASIHIEYLRNMRVTASLTLSLKIGERLWGLVACHHYSGPKFASSSVRGACAILADYLGAAIALKTEQQTFRSRRSKAALEECLRFELQTSECPVTLLASPERNVLALMSDECTGAAVVRGSIIATLGETPSQEHIHELVSWVRNHNLGPLYATDSLSRDLPAARAFTAAASGVLALVPADAAATAIVWFKPETVETLTWGGNPDKSVDVSGMRVHPRKSFEAWVQTVRHRSRPWHAWEREVAESFQLTLTSDELRRRADSEAHARGEAERANRTKQDFMAVISHDLRDPLSSLNLNVLLLKKLLSAEGRTATATAVGSMERAVTQMAGLVKALLDLSALEAGQLTLQLREFDAVDVIRDCVDVLTPIAADKSIGLHVHVPAAPVTIRADRHHLLQVCSNLLGNAIKYTHEGGRVDMRLADSRAAARFEVQDNGPGIPSADLPHVFDRFYRAATAKTRGVGLGLAIAKGVVQAHGGELSVRSEPGKGSTFCFEIPKG